MNSKVWQVAILGTFDVENYGDLLFPILAQAELSKRMGEVCVQPYSYYARTPPQWPFSVTSLTQFPVDAAHLDGIVVGGGHIIRFDKGVAAGYGPPSTAIHHPTGYWLLPGLIGLQNDIPVFWNAAGVHGSVPHWGLPLLKLTLEQSSYISVRNQFSKSELEAINGNVEIQVVPDTAFAISRWVDVADASEEFTTLVTDLGLEKPYIVIQAASSGMDFFLRMVKNNPASFEGFQFVVLPVGPAVGDDDKHIDFPEAIRLKAWPKPLVIAELIGHAAAVVGQSYHLAITALSFGVPAFSTVSLSRGKLQELSRFSGIHSLPIEGDIYPPWFLRRLGKTKDCPALKTTLAQVDAHWDRIAAGIERGGTSSRQAFNALWLDLPNALDNTAREQELLAEVHSLRENLGQLSAKLENSQRAVVKLRTSISYRITAPLRAVMRPFRARPEKKKP